MNVVGVIVLLVACLSPVLVAALAEISGGPTKHERCLANIERLEHDLGIAPRPGDPFVFKPSAPLNETRPNYTQLFVDPVKLEWGDE